MGKTIPQTPECAEGAGHRIGQSGLWRRGFAGLLSGVMLLLLALSARQGLSAAMFALTFAVVLAFALVLLLTVLGGREHPNVSTGRISGSSAADPVHLAGRKPALRVTPGLVVLLVLVGLLAVAAITAGPTLLVTVGMLTLPFVAILLVIAVSTARGR